MQVNAPTVVLEADDATINAAFLATYKLHLMQTDVVVNDGTTIADMPADLTGGFAPKAYTDGTDQGIDPVTGLPYIVGAQLTFTSGGGLVYPLSVYGWWIADGTGDLLIAVGKFDNPATFTADGQHLKVTAKMYLGREFTDADVDVIL